MGGLLGKYSINMIYLNCINRITMLKIKKIENIEDKSAPLINEIYPSYESFQKNPWQAARQVHDDRIGDAYVRAYNWRIVAIITAITALLSVFGIIFIAAQKKYVPYIVEVDNLGRSAMVGFVTKPKPMDERIAKAYLSRFITDFRSVTLDPVPEKSAINRVYSMISVGTPAFNKINVFFKDHSPFEKSHTGSIDVEIISILPISEKIWEVEWSENLRNLQGHIVNITRWKSSLTIAVSPPQEEEKILINPLGIFVTDLSWTKQI